MRIRAIGAINWLLEKLRDKQHACPRGMCIAMLDLAFGINESTSSSIMSELILDEKSYDLSIDGSDGDDGNDGDRRRKSISMLKPEGEV